MLRHGHLVNALGNFLGLDDDVVLHRADMELIETCRKVNFDFARYRRPAAYQLIAERAGPL